MQFDDIINVVENRKVLLFIYLVIPGNFSNLFFSMVSNLISCMFLFCFFDFIKTDIFTIFIFITFISI